MTRRHRMDAGLPPRPVARGGHPRWQTLDPHPTGEVRSRGYALSMALLDSFKQQVLNLGRSEARAKARPLLVDDEAEESYSETNDQVFDAVTFVESMHPRFPQRQDLDLRGHRLIHLSQSNGQ